MNRTRRRNEISARASVVSEILTGMGIAPILSQLTVADSKAAIRFALGTVRCDTGRLVEDLWEKWPDVSSVLVYRDGPDLLLHIEFESEGFPCDGR